MHEIVEYMPVVETYNDVLRLREDQRVNRFRELLGLWSTSLVRNDGDTLSVIRDDVRKAAEGMRGLERVRRVNEWIFWANIPVGLIPIVGTLLAVASTATGLATRRLEARHSWVNVGRAT